MTGKKIYTFRERISALLDESKMTTAELCKELHVSNQTISAWKNGTRSPKEPTIISIANHFGVSPQWLMGFDVPKTSIELDHGLIKLAEAMKVPLSSPMARTLSILQERAGYTQPKIPDDDKEMARLWFRATPAAKKAALAVLRSMDEGSDEK